MPALLPRTYLIYSAEDVSIILLKSPDSGKTRECSTRFIAMQYTEICHPNRKFSVGSFTRAKDEAVSRTVHGLKLSAISDW